ncbi:CAZyme family GT90 [Penicillium concentricum]|uniref:CAZyme family GT90 n=1 Tax=Penicillium concentricum TaxID=293559 RepID=A0A9W9SV16_9EURO|nr:CAZyme family GT90 [Penicillium concentricum]KAJ5384299.1 CAZyme family GT90 [Penicillium concentricum]
MPTTIKRLAGLLPCILLVIGLYIYYQPEPRPLTHNGVLDKFPAKKPNREQLFDGSWDYQRDRDNLMLTQVQCDQAFPDLYAELDRARDDRKSRPISLKELDAIPARNGYIRAMIYDQQLYVIDKEGSIWSREKATLSAINRAILSSPEPLPNIEFVFNTDDSVDELPLWGYARRAKDKSIWLIPDFGHWSWPETKAGSTREVQAKAEWAEEEGLAWSNKTAKLLWRGVPNMGPTIRNKLIQVTKDKSWADVKALVWNDKDSLKNDYKTMPQHCEYQYVAQTEGNTYSGRLKYLQSCRSVVVSHELEWVQHYYHLMKSSGPEQNFVQVRRDWSDLERQMQHLLSHDDEARRIADNSIRTFRERYLSPAAEVCYWRRLMREWKSIIDFEPEFFKMVDGKKVWRGISVESFLLMGEVEYDPR